MKEGDIAGLALLNLPYAWIGVSKHEGGNRLRFYNQQTSESLSKDLKPNTVYLRAYCNFETDTGYLSYSTDGKVFTDISGPIRMPYQLRTFQGVRYALFNYNERGELGGFADFNDFRVGEPRCESLPRPIVRFEEKDQGAASTFQWQDMLLGDLMLMSLHNHRYIFADPMAGSLCSADARGARPDRKGGACFVWELVKK